LRRCQINFTQKLPQLSHIETITDFCPVKVAEWLQQCDIAKLLYSTDHSATTATSQYIQHCQVSFFFFNSKLTWNAMQFFFWQKAKFKSLASLWPCWYGMGDGKMVFYLKLQETCSVGPISWLYQLKHIFFYY